MHSCSSLQLCRTRDHQFQGGDSEIPAAPAPGGDFGAPGGLSATSFPEDTHGSIGSSSLKEPERRTGVSEKIRRSECIKDDIQEHLEREREQKAQQAEDKDAARKARSRSVQKEKREHVKKAHAAEDIDNRALKRAARIGRIRTTQAQKRRAAGPSTAERDAKKAATKKGKTDRRFEARKRSAFTQN